MKSAKILGALVVGLFVTGGCMTPSEESDRSTDIASLPQGMTVLEAVPDTSLSVAYKKNDIVIYFQAMRGNPTPEEYQKDPNQPKFEVDARFVADNGRVFYTQMGGDGWVDPSWADDLERQNDLPPTAVSNELLFDMAAEAAEMLDVEVEVQAGDSARSLVPELNALSTFGRMAPAVFAEQKVHLDDYRVRNSIEPLEIPYGTNGPEDADKSLGANYYYIALHDASITLTLGAGRHSATRLYAWSGSWVHVHSFCNHGSCAGDMSQKCLLQYYEATSDYKPAWTAYTCNTGYDAFSDNGGHNCHDDSRLQMASFVYGKNFSTGNQYWCNDSDSPLTDISNNFWFGDHEGSPECNSTQSKGFNHPSWCNYSYSTDYACPSSWQGTNDGCDCGCLFPDGTRADPDCG